MVLKMPSKAVEWAKVFVAPALCPGSVAVDATAGRGRDTVFLSHAVGSSGRVYAFDIQSEALKITSLLLREEGVRDRVTLIQAGHELMERYVNESVNVVMFNLGYLPGSDGLLATKPDTSAAGIQSGLKLLAPGGRMSIVVYAGHPGGKEELAAVEEMAAALDPAAFAVIRVSFLNRSASAPVLMLIEKLRAGAGNEGTKAEQDFRDCCAKRC